MSVFGGIVLGNYDNVQEVGKNLEASAMKILIDYGYDIHSLKISDLDWQAIQPGLSVTSSVAKL